MSALDRMTERQRTGWLEAIASIRQRDVEVTDDPDGYYWRLDFAEEVRPGRGHYLNATFLDGEYFVQVLMDVYGGPSVSIAALDWIHSDNNEECDCEPCVAEREADA